MAADLHIHIRTSEVTGKVLKDFFSSSIGSPYFNPLYGMAAQQSGAFNTAFSVIADTPNVNVGEVSWLKAALTGESDTFVPSAVGKVQALIDSSGDATITDELIEQVQAAMQLTNDTGYDVSDGNKIIEFLQQHKGKQAFTVSW